MDDDFEEWKTWFDSHKDEDGSINLSDHLPLVRHMNNILGMNPKKINMKDLENLGSTINFDVNKIKHG